MVEQGYKVALVAKDMPEDAESVGFASPWAVSFWNDFIGWTIRAATGTLSPKVIREARNGTRSPTNVLQS